MNTARELSNHLAELLKNERHALADFLVALAAFDRERGWAELDHPSLFDFLHRRLGLSNGAAFYRQTAARLVQAHPAIVEPLRDGRPEERHPQPSPPHRLPRVSPQARRGP
jgi:hypothetical protein